mmetsp:Transcript_33100/g.72580  ORF Transcript_33100/g.72580 Transcript_33100/m.72580 type:complete len:263 (+) Transcript_33100:1185-1973(+)
MDQLPTALVNVLILLLVGKSGHGVVSGNIPTEIPNQDGNDEQRQEQHDQDGIGNGIPVNLRRDQMILVEVDVPPRRPCHLALVPDDVVGVDYLLVLLNDLVGVNVIAAHVSSGRTRRERFGVAVGTGTVPLVPAQEGVSDAHGLDGEPDDAVPVLPRGRSVVVDVDVDVVVDVGVAEIAGTGIDETDGEAAGVVLLSLSGLGETYGRGGDVVNDPIVVVAVPDVHPKIPRLDLAQLDLAQDLAVRLLEHVDGVRGVLDLVPR